MGIFWDRLKFGSTVALNCRNRQNKGRYFTNKISLRNLSQKAIKLNNVGHI